MKRAFLKHLFSLFCAATLYGDEGQALPSASIENASSENISIANASSENNSTGIASENTGEIAFGNSCNAPFCPQAYPEPSMPPMQCQPQPQFQPQPQLAPEQAPIPYPYAQMPQASELQPFAPQPMNFPAQPPQNPQAPMPYNVAPPQRNESSGVTPEGAMVKPLFSMGEKGLDSRVEPKCPADLGPGYTVNFDDIPVTQLIKFIAQISEINFIYDSADLRDIRITFVSDEPTKTSDLLAALLQVLRMHGLSSIEEGNNVLIYKNATLSKVASIVSDENAKEACGTAFITRVFRLYNLSPDKVGHIIKPFLSKDAVVEVLNETRHLIVSDITANVNKIGDLLAVIDTPNLALEIAEYPVKHGMPTVLVGYVKEILQPLLPGNPFQIMGQESAGKIFIVSSPYLVGKALSVLNSLDTVEIADVVDLPATTLAGNRFYVYALKYRDGREIEQALRDIGENLEYLGVTSPDLVAAIYSIQWLEVNNSIVVVGTDDAVTKVVHLIEDIDTPPKQVYIEVLIINTTISNALNFGVEWVALANEQNKLAFATGFLNPAPPGAPVGAFTGLAEPPLLTGARAAMTNPPPNAARGGVPGTGGDVPLTSGFGLGIVGNIIRNKGMNFLTLGALINALESDSDTVVVLNPKIMVEDMQEANIFVGQNIPYQTTSTVIRDTGSVTQNIQYEDIGVQLRVTPHVGPGGMVTLEIDQSVSDVSSSTATIASGGPAGNTVLLAPTTNKILTTTRVHVPDGCFLVMSGQVRDQMTATRTGIPCLGTLPLIGPAFSNTVETRTKMNLIMFLQPHVIGSVRDGLEVTNKEGYKYNWESHPSSIIELETRRAPENSVCPPPKAENERMLRLPGLEAAKIKE